MDHVQVSVPKGTPLTPYRAKQTLELPAGAGIPFISKDDPPEKQIKRQLISGARCFNLSLQEDLDEYNRVWTLVAAGGAKMCSHPDPVYDPTKGAWVAFLRWGAITLRLPE